MFKRFLDHPDLKCGLQRLTSAFPRGFGLFPTKDQLLRPWAGVDSSWDIESSRLLEMCPEPIVSHILLSPASGEQFDITIQLLDQMLNLATASVTLQVQYILRSVLDDCCMQLLIIMDGERNHSMGSPMDGTPLQSEDR